MDPPLQNGQQLFESDLAFANDDDVRTRSQILVDVDTGLRATDDGFPPGLLRRLRICSTLLRVIRLA